jgi:hypothetical protein
LLRPANIPDVTKNATASLTRRAARVRWKYRNDFALGVVARKFMIGEGALETFFYF